MLPHVMFPKLCVSEISVSELNTGLCEPELNVPERVCVCARACVRVCVRVRVCVCVRARAMMSVLLLGTVLISSCARVQ